MYLLMAIIAVVVSFSVAGAWFVDRDTVDSTMDIGGAVIVKLVGTGEDGTIQNFKQLYDSDGGAYPGDKILDSIKVQMGEKTEESVLRVQYSVDILDKEKNVKTQDLTEAETKLATLLKNDLRAKTTLFSSDWSQTTSDWIYYKHLASGKTKPIDLFDEYSLPLPDSEMDNQYQELSFRISLVAEAIQAANIMSHNEWNDDITNLSDSALMERVIKYNGERFAEVDEVLPYIETTGGQYIDTLYHTNINTAIEVSFQTKATGTWLFGTRISYGTNDTFAAYIGGTTMIWCQLANDSSSTQFKTPNFSDKQSVLVMNKDNAKLNGQQIGTFNITAMQESKYPAYIGTTNHGGAGEARYFVGKIFGARIWDNGELVRFFVPARDKDGNVGFYDLVTHQMFLNAGTGNFAYGHSINYIANGGTIATNAPKTFVSGDLPITLPVPTRAGYEFDGWFLSSDFSGVAQTTIPAGTDSNVYVYAKWIKTYNITYHLGGGINAEDNPTEFNERTLPLTLKAPTRDGFTFGGWYQNPACSGNQVTTIEVGTEKNVSLWAKWNAIEYSVSYVLNGGINSDQNVAKYSILDTPVKLYNPTRDGYLFEGWFASSDFSGQRMTYLSKDNLGDVTLHAKWSLAYTITYNTNGGFNDGRNPSVFTENTETFTLFAAEKVNYSFLGWFDNEELTGTPITQIAKGTKNNIVLWAKWSSTQITVTFNPNGGGVSPLTKVVKKGGTYGDLPIPTKAGYTFNGWGFAMPLSVGANTVRQDDYTIKSGAANVDTFFWVNQNYHLTIGNQYVVKFYAIVDPNNTWRLSPQNRTPEFSLKNGYNEVTFIAGDSRGFFFDDKNPDPEHPFIITDVIIEAQTEGEIITFSTTKYVNSETQITLENNHTLFAQWTENVYAVTYNLDGGTNAAGNPATFKRSNLPITLLDATKDGEYFAGWYLDAEFTKRVTKIDAGSLKDIELWARFSQSPLVFDLVGSSAYSVRAANTSISGNIEIPQTYNGKPVVVIQNSAFKDCSSLTSILIPNSIKSIGINAFENCSNITETTIPEGVTLIGNNTFLGCEKLASVTLPTSLENIGANAFAGCTSLTSIVLPKNVAEIGANAFANCSKLATIEVFGDTPATLKNNVFPNSVSKIYVKPSLVATYKTAWAEYKDKIVGFAEYSITYNLNGGTNSTKNISSFTKIDVPIKLYDPSKENADFLGWYATPDFSGEKVTEITTASNVTLYARWDRKMTITYVLNGGINSSANLSTITESMLPYSLMPASREYYTFINWYLDDTLTTEISIISTFGNTTIYAKWEELDPNLVFTLNPDGVSYSVKASSTNISGVVRIPKTYRGKPVTTIKEEGFVDCSKVNDLIFPNTLTTIEQSAFKNCTSMTKIYIPSSVTTISAPYSSASPFYGWNQDAVIYCEASSKPDGWESSWNYYGSGYLTTIWNVAGFPQQTADWEYVEKKDGAVALVRYLGTATAVTVPTTLSGKTVSEICENCFKDKTSINSIYIPSSITSVGRGAMSGCGALATLTIPFVGGSSTSNSFLGYIFGAWSYSNNSNSVPSSLKTVVVTGGTSIESDAFYDCSSLTSITIPNSVTSIGSSAFRNCTSMTKIYIPSSVTTISAPYSSASPFYGWNKDAVIYCGASSKPDGWGSDWNYYGSSGYSLEFLKTIWNVAGLPQQNADWEYVEKNDGTMALVRYLGTATAVTVPTTLSGKTVSEICGNCFKDKKSINNIYIPSSVTTISALYISDSPFYGCNSSAAIYCGASSKPSGWGNGWNYYSSSSQLKTIWNVAGFPQQNADWEYVEKTDGTIRVEKYIGSATAVAIPSTLSEKTVSEIQESCFNGKTAITSITIPSSVAIIGNNAFNGCSGLTRVNISDLAAWFNIKFGSTNANPLYYAHHLYLNNTELTEITIPNSITKINAYALCGASAITSITLPNSVTSIGGYAFEGCRKLTSINIPAGVTSIGYDAFSGCSSLTSITIPDSVTSIGSSAFKNCTAMRRIYIPSSVTTISASSYSYSPFYGWDSTSIIYCGASSKPSGWESVWNYYGSSSQLRLKTIWNALGFSQQNADWEYVEKNDGAVALMRYLGTATVLTVPTTLSGKTVNEICENCFKDKTSINKIYIPSSVTTIVTPSYSKSPFYGGNGSAVIYCGASSKPSGWGNSWNYYSSSSRLKTIWNVAGLPQQNSEWEYVEKNDGTMTLVKYLGTATVLTVPSTLSGKTVSEICENCFRGKKSINNIYIPSSVTTIFASSYSDSPFFGCNSSAVIYCGAPSKPSGWGDGWNYYSSSSRLKTIWNVVGFPQQNADWEYVEKTDGTIRVEKYIGSATAVAIPSTLSEKTVSEIQESCFKGKAAISSLTIPSSVTSIGSSAFSGCTAMARIYVPSSVTTISASSYSYSPFYGWNSSAVIYCEASSKPSGWGTYWNYYDSTNALKAYYQTSDCIHEDGVWAYDSNGEIKTINDISWIVDVEPTTETEGSKHGVCPVCGQTVTVVIPKKMKITITNDSSYPWTITNNSAAVSTNKQHNTSSTLTLTFTGNGKIRIKYKTSSEANYDKLTITHNSTTIGIYSGTSQSTFTTLADITVSSGDTIKFTYSKDGSQSKGSDCAWVEWEIVE